MIPPALTLHGITQRFPGVLALRDVNLSVARGSCHALVGENGAGKSTLGKLVAGIYTPDAGTIEFEGRPVRFGSPRDALLAGIGMVYQELAFCENLSVWENLNLGHTPRRGPFVDRREAIRRAREALAAIQADIDPGRTVADLTVGQQQLVQIAGAVSRGARLLIFDEPTSSLTRLETRRLFDLIRRLRARQVTSLYVSHRLDEIFELCDTVTVLRDGAVVETRPVAQLTESELVRLMIGRPLEAYFPSHVGQPTGPELLSVDALSSPGRFEDISFTLHAGEVLGLAGLVGSGRTEVAEALFGLDTRTRGRVRIAGQLLPAGGPAAAMARGLGLIPEDRKRHGLVLPMNARENISLPTLRRLSRFGWIRHRAERDIAQRFFQRLSIRAPGVDTVAASLSGGNQQKLVIARWLAADARVLLVDEPTRGVDVGAKAEIHGLIDALAGEGKGILLISSDLPEILHLSTRILVFHAGRIAGVLSRAEATQESVMRLMAGMAA